MGYKSVVLFFVPISLFAAECPNGFIVMEYADFVPAVSGGCPVGYIAHEIDDVCSDDSSPVCWLIKQMRVLCGAGIDKIKTSTGIVVPLYADKYTTPSVHVRYNDTVCYADLEPGNVAGAINIKFNGDVYHTLK